MEGNKEKKGAYLLLYASQTRDIYSPGMFIGTAVNVQEYSVHVPHRPQRKQSEFSSQIVTIST